MNYLHVSDFSNKTPRQLVDRINQLYNKRGDNLDCFADTLTDEHSFEEAPFLESRVLERRILFVLKDGSDVKNAVLEINQNSIDNRDEYLERLSACLSEHVWHYTLCKRAALNIIIS